MRVLDIWPMQEGSNSLARFDLELNDQVRNLGLILKRNESGHLRIFAPKSGGQHAASFKPELSQQITLAAIAAYEGKSHVSPR